MTRRFFKFHFYYHRFTIAFASVVLFWAYIVSMFQVDIVSIAWVIETISSEFWEQFREDKLGNPTDFINKWQD